jgi:hypothetical protein
MMVAFLSPDWIRALDEAARDHPGLPDAAVGLSLVVEQEVTDAPGGPVRFHVVFGDGSVRVRTGPAPQPTVRFSQDLATATAIATGTESAQRAFMTGRLQVGGDLRVLLEGREALAALDDVFASVRRTTEHPDPTPAAPADGA